MGRPAPTSNLNPTQLYTFDALNRLTSVTQPWTGVGGGTAATSYQYDVQDHLTRVTDAEGNVTTYPYSDRDVMTSQVSPASGTTTFYVQCYENLGRHKLRPGWRCEDCMKNCLGQEGQWPYQNCNLWYR